MIKSIRFEKDARDKILAGVQKIAKAVRVTMGGAGKNVLIGESVYGNDGLLHIQNRVTKDGFMVTKYFELPDTEENRGSMALKEAAMQTVELAGDATTCTCVLAEYLITEGMKLIDSGANSQEIKKGMDKALENIVSQLNKMSTPVKGNIERIRQIATVSANNDKTIGDLIADAFSKIGDEGVINIEPSQGMKTEIKIIDGYKFERGWVSPYFINNGAKESCEFNNPLILLYQNRINHHTQIEKAVQISLQQNRPLLIIAEDCTDEGLAYLAINNYGIKKQISVCVVKCPFGENRNEEMEDIALLTGGDYVSDITGIDVKEVTIENLGQAEKVIISKTETSIIKGNKDETKFDDLVNDLRMNLTQAKTEQDKYPIEKRIAKLTGKGAVIIVGAATETELNEKLDRVDDAVRSTKSAISAGFLPGGGTAFLRVNKSINGIETSDIQKGESLVYLSLSSPIIQICTNAGVDAIEVFKKVSDEKNNMGYNVLTGEIVDMVDAGIIDSTKALTAALTNAVSVAGMMLTVECSIISTS